jgi:hypothetical protein
MDQLGTYTAVILLVIFLPTIVALRGGNPVWKFLSFLFSAIISCL